MRTTEDSDDVPFENRAADACFTFLERISLLGLVQYAYVATKAWQLLVVGLVGSLVLGMWFASVVRRALHWVLDFAYRDLAADWRESRVQRISTSVLGFVITYWFGTGVGFLVQRIVDASSCSAS